MVSIGGCDYCGEFCSALAVTHPEEFELNGWVPTSAINRHNALVDRRLECSIVDGNDYFPRHVGPYHDRNGVALTDCPNCSNNSQMDAGYWDTELDHEGCLECWADFAGPGRLRKLRQGDPSPTSQPAVPVEDADAVRAVTSTERADRDRVEAAFRAYLNGTPLPIRWVGSPRTALEALQHARKNLDPGLRAGPDGAPPWSLAADDRHLESGSAIVPEESALAAELVARLIGAELGDEDAAEIMRGSGQFAVVPPTTLDEALLALLAEIRASSGPALVLKDEIVVTERPLVLRLDDRSRPHSADGPAIAYPDGFAAFAWHGVRVPEWFIRTPDRISVNTIDEEPNAEIRRVMIERFGAERLIREGQAELVDEDSTGRLWRRAFSGAGEPVVMVEVRNSTPEPDGSRKTYFLRVPPHVRTARDAVAWTFGMTGRDYQPAIES